MASDGSRAVGRTIGRFASRRSDVFRTVDRRQSSHAYSTALSTPPSQEGKNHPRVPDAPLRHPYPLLERKRRDEDEAIATARIDRWGRVGRKREIHGNWARDAARRGATTPVCRCCRRREPTGKRMGALAISFVYRVGFCRRSKITGRRPSIASTRSSSAKLDKLPGRRSRARFAVFRLRARFTVHGSPRVRFHRPIHRPSNVHRSRSR